MEQSLKEKVVTDDTSLEVSAEKHSEVQEDEKVQLTPEENKQFKKDSYEFVQNFNRLMLEKGLFNKFNKTYGLRLIKPTKYGFYGQLYLTDGLTFSELRKIIGDIQENLCCIFIMKTRQFQRYADIEIINKAVDGRVPFIPPKLKPWEIFVGVTFSFKPIIINMHDYCMFLLSGATGSGKTYLIYTMLLSWITSCTPEEIEIYLGDIAKNEYIQFEKCKHVKFYASELEELDKMIKMLEKEFQRRKKLLSATRAKGLATNIREYNNISKQKLSTIIIINDEFSVLLPDKTDNLAEKKMKQRALDALKFFSKTGRNLGLFTLESLQKAVKDEIPSIIKSQSAVRMSLTANDAISSEVIMGDNSAVGLEKRYGVYSLNGGEEKKYFYVPYLDTKTLNEMIEPHLDEEYRKIKAQAQHDKKPFNPNMVEISTTCKVLKKKGKEVKDAKNGGESEYVDY